MRLAFLLVSTAVAIAIPAPAAGGQTLIEIGGGSGNVRATDARVLATGLVAVDFRSDDSGACVAFRICGVAGSVTWTPGPRGDLTVVQYRSRHGRPRVYALLQFAGDSGGRSGTRTAARIDRVDGGVVAGTCSDLRAGERIFEPAAAGASALTFRVGAAGPSPYLDGSLLHTRCAGPLDEDITPLLPARTLPIAQLAQGGASVDLRTSRPFSSRGLVGTVRSSLVLSFAKPKKQVRRTPKRFKQFLADARKYLRRHRTRTLTASYSIDRIAGTVAADFYGPVERSGCLALDACGITGLTSVNPATTSGTVKLFATGPSRRPRRDLLAAIGLSRGGSADGIETYGQGDWKEGNGSTTATVTRAGSIACQDTVPLREGFLSLSLGRRLHVAYGTSGFDSSSYDPLRTRCPGPAMADLTGSSLARGTFPLSVFRHRVVTLRLTGGADFLGAGYRGRTRPALTVVLSRKSVRAKTDPVLGLRAGR